LELTRLAYGGLDSVQRDVIVSGEAAFDRTGDYFRATIPFKATKVCQRCHQVPLDYTLGAADIYVSLGISKSVDENWKRSLVIFAVFLLSAVGIGIMAFRRVVAEPIQNLLDATDQISKGELDRQIALPRARDELGTLSVAFEDMRRSLRKTQDELIRSERLSTIGQMASTIIHDFNNPLTVVSSYTDMLKRHPEMSEAQRNSAYDASLKAINQMSTMTSDLLYFSRGKMKFNLQRITTGVLVNDVKESVAFNLDKRGVKFHIQDLYQGEIRVDLDHFRRALINIITNAQEAMPNGGQVTMRVQRSNGCVEFKLSDTGVGICEEIRAHLFDPFVTHGKPNGTGLGLAITKLIVEEHSGSIEVESTVGVGTTFSLLIPISES